MKMIGETLHGLAIGRPECCGNLCQFPLYGADCGEPPYLTLDEAIENGDVEITEASGGGRVPIVHFASQSPRPVFLLDGQELIGAMQDRVLNISLLAPPGRRLTIPVTCVEAARWEPATPAFEAAQRVHFASGRAERTAQVTESLVYFGQPHSDQVEVWSTIEAAAERLDAASPTHAHSALFTRHAPSVEAAVSAFHAAPGQTGALFAAGESILGFDLFDSAATFAKMLPKLVRSSAVDAIYCTGAPPSIDDAAQFIDMAAKAHRLRFAAVGIGVDIRLSGEGVAGGALAAWNRLVHLAAFGL